MSINKISLTLQLLLVATSVYAQDHISFNGATFGQTKSIFLSSLISPNKSGHEVLMEHTYKNMYRWYLEPGGSLNSYKCQFYIHCSINTQIVFETITWFKVSNLKSELTLFVRFFEEKYGGHIKEDPNNLDYIPWYRFDYQDSLHNYWPIQYSRKEMLALKYIIHRKSDNKAIGEVRISAAPDSNPTNENDSGLIEITYRDYAAADSAINEYTRIMNQIL